MDIVGFNFRGSSLILSFGFLLADLEEGDSSSPDAQAQARLEAQAQAELKFTYVVTCQIYGEQKRKGKVQAADILYLMQM